MKIFKSLLNIQPIDQKLYKNTHRSTNILVILVSKSQSQIYIIFSKKVITFQKYKFLKVYLKNTT